MKCRILYLLSAFYSADLPKSKQSNYEVMDRIKKKREEEDNRPISMYDDIQREQYA